MDLSQIRTKIDAVDDEIIRLFCQRMALSEEVAAYKKGTGTPIRDAGREREKTISSENRRNDVPGLDILAGGDDMRYRRCDIFHVS